MQWLLEHRTEGEAKKVVAGVKDKNGFEPWRRLHERFEAGLGSMLEAAMQELSDSLKRPATVPEETCFNYRIVDENVEIG